MENVTGSIDISVVHSCGHEGTIDCVVVNPSNVVAWRHVFESTPCKWCMNCEDQKSRMKEALRTKQSA